MPSCTQILFCEYCHDMHRSPGSLLQLDELNLMKQWQLYTDAFDGKRKFPRR